MIKDDEYLERIVAGIHAITTDGAEVLWNEIINGRQFDVTIRFKIGTLRYLVLVEVKNRKRKAAASDLEAFALKARDHNANKSVFVTASGFQEGAITVAKRHAVDIFTVTFDDSKPTFPAEANFIIVNQKNSPENTQPILEFGEKILVAQIEDAELIYIDGKHFHMPNESSQMQYYCKNTKLENGLDIERLLKELNIDDIELEKTITRDIKITPPSYITPPDKYFIPTGIIKEIKLKITGRIGRTIKGNVLIEPSTFSLPILYKNVITGEKYVFDISQLPLGDNRVSVGSFYFISHPLMYYYCDSINNELIRWHLIESFQNGQKITGTFKQDIIYSKHYIKVSDKKIIERLEGRLFDFIKNSNKNK
ncbi:restriction endonuclease [Xanthobacter sp. VTT E-85241]|uniref:restriction endonuclease n=1 Tax=Roseixanthobacter finlandensis TaxID=3119922 RepID=UPI00372763D2